VVAACVVALGAAVTGCGGGSPPVNRAAAASPLAVAQRSHEYPAPRRPVQRARGSRSPVAAIVRFAERYVNWTAADASARMLSLARDSVGQARSQMALTAAEVHADPTLRQGGIANRGTVEGVAPRRGHANQYVVVTREQTLASATAAYQGLAPAWHLTIATVTAEPGGRWVVSGWQPES
jgi:hypothetical protein